MQHNFTRLPRCNAQPIADLSKRRTKIVLAVSLARGALRARLVAALSIAHAHRVPYAPLHGNTH